jgi:hypothetical protein
LSNFGNIKLDFSSNLENIEKCKFRKLMCSKKVKYITGIFPAHSIGCEGSVRQKKSVLYLDKELVEKPENWALTSVKRLKTT